MENLVGVVVEAIKSPSAIPLFVALVLILLVGAQRQIDKVKDMAQQNRMDIKDLRLHVSENYSTKTEIQASLARIHDRLDELFKVVITKFKS